jgi:hypothetical protein
MNIIEDQQGAGLQVGVKKIILEVRERVAVWSVKENELQLFGEAVL